MKKSRKPARTRDRTVISLKDLDPRTDPKGGDEGSGKIVFGGGEAIFGPGSSAPAAENKERGRKP